MRRRVTYNPEKTPLGDLIERAIDSQQTLLGSTEPFGGEEVQEAPGGLISLPWALDGSDPEHPVKQPAQLPQPERAHSAWAHSIGRSATGRVWKAVSAAHLST